MRAALWHSEDAVRAAGGESTVPWRASGVSIDSRTIRPGELFIALKGPVHDGHAHVADAMARGAAAAVVDHRPPGIGEAAPLLIVEDTLTALVDLARFARARSAARVIAVTGSVGKTGTKEMLRQVLARFAPTQASAASHNNHWGVPLTLANLAPQTRHAVIEIGMNHPGEIRPLAKLARPHVVVITAIAPTHLEFLGSLENIARAKAEIFEGLETDGIAIVNADAPRAELLLDGARDAGATVITTGEADAADIALRSLRPDGGGSEVEVQAGAKRWRYRLGMPGRHIALNSLLVLAVVNALDLDVEAALPAFGTLEAPEGRGRMHEIAIAGGTLRLIDESYNASPASVAAALSILASQPGRRVAVLGDMLELGAAAPDLHRELAVPLQAADIAVVLTCGPLMSQLSEALPPSLQGVHFADSQALAQAIPGHVRPGDVVLVKGSLGMAMRRVKDALLALSATPAGERC